MPAIWPAALPTRIQQDAAQGGMGDGRIMSRTDKGPGKSRRGSTAVVRPMSGTMVMSEAQRQALEDFVNADIAGGSLPFEFPSQWGAEDPWLVMIAKDSMPSWVPAGPGYWNVTLKLDILP